MTKKNWKNILLFLFSGAASLYFLELALGIYLVKSVLHYPLPPFSMQTHTTLEYAVRYNYNNISLRGSDFNPKRQYDWVLLGDSFLFGQGVDEEKTLQGLLEKKGYLVLNLSEMATNPIDYYHKLRVLKSHQLKMKNIVVGFYMGNDFQDIGDKRLEKALAYSYRDNFLDYNLSAFIRLERLRYQMYATNLRFREKLGKKFSDYYKEEVKVHAFEHPRKFYTEWLEFFTQKDENMMRAMRGEDRKPVDLQQISEDEYIRQLQINDASLDNTLKIIRAILQSAGAARVYLLLIPDFYTAVGLKSIKYESYVRRLMEGVLPSVSIIDLHGKMPPDAHFALDRHWNARGHELAAEIILRNASSSP